MLSKLTGASTVWWFGCRFGTWIVRRHGVKAIDQALVALPISGVVSLVQVLALDRVSHRVAPVAKRTRCRSGSCRSLGIT